MIVQLRLPQNEYAMSVGGRSFYQEINQLTNGLSANLWSAIISNDSGLGTAVIETVSSNTNAFLTSHVSVMVVIPLLGRQR